MIETVSGIPDFDEYGNLPYACYEVSLDEIEEHFVKNFPDSDSRKSRFECFLRFYNDLIRNVKSGVSILIDGSFVENKNNPCDVDLVIIIDSERLNDFEFNYLINELKYNEIIKQEYLYLKKQVNGGLGLKRMFYSVIYKTEHLKALMNF
ncbi:DUF6932 family protein [Methanobrevibacter sp.]|uniref:DUF6932 family protein n=1 Tax=Methanobrevibacter sp. TaxID=66852 RepID=UPI00388F373D